MGSDGSDLDKALRLVGSVRDGELDCDESFTLLAAYVDHLRGGPPSTERDALVKEHLVNCGFCREELEALLLALDEST
jgi:hypothetical protein